MANQNPAIAIAATREAMKALTETARSRDNKLSSPAVAGAKDDLVDAMEARISKLPEIQHASNTEPWYTKRSRWGAIIGPSSFIIGIMLKITGVDIEFGAAEAATLADALTALGVGVSALFSLWAGIATKPMFSK